MVIILKQLGLINFNKRMCKTIQTSQVVPVLKNLPAKVGDRRDVGSIPGSGRSPERGHSNPVFLPGESHGQRGLVGYSPWSHKEVDTTEVT